MLKFLKYLPMVGLFQDVSESYKAETGKDRPAFLSRRFIGSMLLLTGGLSAILLGVSIDSDVLNTIADKIETIISAGIVIYGLVLGIVGQKKKAKSDTRLATEKAEDVK